MKKNKSLYVAVVVSVLTYLFFFYPFLKSNHFFWLSDVRNYYYPVREYFYHKVVNEGQFPFWTEKQFSGFPIYADLETTYLNIPNILSIIIFGPINSYKILHFFQYFLGSMGLYHLLRRKGIGVLGFAVANAALYFSSFFINKQVHFGIVMALYLFPLLLLLYDLFLEKRRMLYIVLSALVFSLGIFYWGHLQITLIAYIGYFFYTLVFSFRNLPIKTFVFYTVSVGLLIVTFCLPQLLPTYHLAQRSIRSPGGVSIFQGSLVPNMITLMAYPTVFGESDVSFSGRTINHNYSYVETYSLYFGITTLILAITGLLLTRNDRLKTYSLILLFVFFIMGFMEYVPVIDFEKFPLITLFRYWNRTSFLAGVGISLLAAKSVQSLKDRHINISLPSILMFVGVTAYWTILLLLSRRNHKSVVIMRDFLRKLPHETNYSMWIGFIILIVFTLLLSFLLTFLFRRFTDRYKLHVLFRLLIFLIVLLDLRYFHNYMLNLRIQEPFPIDRAKVPPEFENIRIVMKSDAMSGMENLYYPSWSPFGYSQLAEEGYNNAFRNTGTTNIKNPKDFILNKSKQREVFRPLGVHAVIHNKSIYYLGDEDVLDILDGQYSGSYEIKKEGHLRFTFDEAHEGIIKTYIKNYPGWKLRLDGSPAEFIQNDDVFLSFEITSDVRTVEIRFEPIHFCRGILLSLFLGISMFATYKYLQLKSIIDSLLRG